MMKRGICLMQLLLLLVLDCNIVSQRSSNSTVLNEISDIDIISLPNFTINYTDFVLSSMIERTADSSNLFATTFLLNHKFPMQKKGIDRYIDSNYASIWNNAIVDHFSKTYYTELGERSGDFPMYCFISPAVMVRDGTASSLESSYHVMAEFVPTAGGIDANAMFGIEIIRCPLHNSKKLLGRYAGRSDVNLQVELSYNNQSVGDSVIKFYVPWNTRMTGHQALHTGSIRSVLEKQEQQSDNKLPKFLPSTPQEYVRESLAYSVSSLNIDAWKGLKVASIGPKEALDSIYLCVVGWDSHPSIHNIPLILQFIEHHLLVGVTHIFIGVALSWQSPHMQVLLRTLRPYLMSGKLSIFSHSGDDIDQEYSVGGIVWFRDYMKVLAVNQCIYFAKGMVEYVGVWDFDEFFIPMGDYHSLPHLLLSIDNVRDNKPAMAQHKHPTCYFDLSSLSLFYTKPSTPASSQSPVDHWQHDITPSRANRKSNASHTVHSYPITSRYAPLLQDIWLHDNFNLPSVILAHHKAIYSTRKIMHAGLHTPNTCQIDQLSIFSDLNFDHNHTIKDLVTPKGDSYGLNKTLQGLLYHFQFFRKKEMKFLFSLGQRFFSKFSSEGLNHTVSKSSRISHRYAKKYSDQVLQGLDQKGLFHPIELLHSASYSQRNTLLSQSWPQPVVNMSNLNKYFATMRGCRYFPLPIITPRLWISSSLFIRNTNGHNGSESYGLVVSTFLPPFDKYLYAKFQYESLAKSKRSRSWDLEHGNIVCKVILRNPNTRQRISYVNHGNVSKFRDSQTYTIFCPLPDQIASKKEDYQIRVQLLLSNHSVSNNSKMICFSVRYQGISGRTLHQDQNGRYIAHNHTIGHEKRMIEQNQRSTYANVPSHHNISSFLPVYPMHLCVVSGFAMLSPFSQSSLAMLVEFMQHHLLMGVEHIYLPVHALRYSHEFNAVLSVLRSFLSDGLLTVWSTDTFFPNPNNETNHLRYNREISRGLVKEMCIVYAVNAKVEYLGFWDLKQFYLPQLDARSMEIIKSLYIHHNLGHVFKNRSRSDLLAQPQFQLNIERKEVLKLTSMHASLSDFIRSQASAGSIPWIGVVYANMIEDHPLTSSQVAGVIFRVPEVNSQSSILTEITRMLTNINNFTQHQDLPIAGRLLDVYDFSNPYYYNNIMNQRYLCLAVQRETIRSQNETDFDSSIGFKSIPDLSCPNKKFWLEESLQENGSWQENIYQIFFFPIVYATLARRDLDLFVDILGVNETGLSTLFPDPLPTYIQYEPPINY